MTDTSTMGSFRYERRPFNSRSLGREVHYGVLTPEGAPADHRETVYLLHGSNGDDTQAMQARAPEFIDAGIVDRLRSRGIRIVLPFIGASFLHGDFSRYFFEELLPETGAKRRHLTGFSSGGQAALNAFLRQPELFDSVGAHYPTLISFDFTRPEQVDSYIAKHRVVEPYRSLLLDQFRNEFRGDADFSGCDPIRLAESIDPARLTGKRIYFDVGASDEFGLYEGAERLHSTLTRRGIAHIYENVPGKHDAEFVLTRLSGMLGRVLG